MYFSYRAAVLISASQLKDARVDSVGDGQGDALHVFRAQALTGGGLRQVVSEARSRLYRSRSLQVNSHFAAFFEIYKICTLFHRSNSIFWRKLSKIFRKFAKFSNIFENLKKFVIFFQNPEIFDEIFENFEIRAAQNCENLVDLEKCCKMIIYLPRSAPIQPRTSQEGEAVVAADDLPRLAT